ncbi:NUDIX hydrolase [Nakamurella lactea]|uniref:NUDIX hydrolase n=1 Tax=Nakamurella lactea TaxID=459515 RepID=UPI000404CA0E|nr:NUDIX domain-containing protein [Nakamurella lactea]
MAIPDFVLELRRHVGTMPLWLIGCTAVVLRDGAAGAAGAAEPELLMVRRADNGAWTAVTGIVDPGEHPAMAAVRETLEETAITAEVTALVQVGVTGTVTYQNGDRTQYLDLTYRCRYVAGDPHPADGENAEVRWVSLAALGALRPAITPHMRARIDAALADDPQPRSVPLERD